MPRVDFSTVPDGSAPGDTVPDGTYTATIIGIEPKPVSKGVLWEVWSEIQDGDFKGKRIKDAWFWYGGGLGRTKACISGCGLTQEGEANYLPEHFIGLPVILDVVNESRMVGEKPIEECKPRYAGYHFDDQRPWNPKVIEPEPPKQGNVFDSSNVPF